MHGIGTIINVGCIIGGGIVGLIAGNRFKKEIRDSLMTITGIGVIMLGAGGTMAKMLSVADGHLEAVDSVMMIVCLALGVIVGELLKLEDKITKFGEWLKVKSHSTSDNSFVGGFVSASCTVCIGAMAVIGSIQDGIEGDYSILLAKGILDAIIICIMAAGQGKGCVFSAIPVGILQGTVTLVAMFAGDFIPEAALSNLSYVGNVLILCVGLNLIREKKIKVANALPAIVFALIWGCVTTYL
ncbi:MAG: DUF554 domain-containing protein [Lachnospiraceae bacterium]|nr:DUF554 domain-containing protein [Lachnospiraceae bacterium]